MTWRATATRYIHNSLSDSGSTGNPHDPGETGNPHDVGEFHDHQIHFTFAKIDILVMLRYCDLK
jgi:hypothetical protein